nr:hypothetical protein [Tanacetum cinerariifolium]
MSTDLNTMLMSMTRIMLITILRWKMTRCIDDEKYDKSMSMIESNKEENQIYDASFAAHDASFTALATHVDRLLEQLNRDETYEPQGIISLDFDDEDEDEDEEQNEEFSLHSTNTMEYSTFGSCKNKEDIDDHNNSFEDLISPIKEQR